MLRDATQAEFNATIQRLEGLGYPMSPYLDRADSGIIRAARYRVGSDEVAVNHWPMRYPPLPEPHASWEVDDNAIAAAATAAVAAL
jgi:hypothetical protein